MKNRTQTKGRMSCLPEENDDKTLSVSQLAFKKKDEKVHSLPCYEPFGIS